MVNRSLTCRLILGVLVFWVGALPAHGRIRQVVLLYDERTTLPGLAALDASIVRTLTSSSPEPVEVYRESMDLSRFGSDTYLLALQDYLRKKYAKKKIDVVLAAMSPALDFLLNHEKIIFPGTPVVFCGIDRREFGDRALPSRVTGVMVKREFAPTLDIALKLHPDTSRVVFVAGTSEFDKRLLVQASEELRRYQDHLDFIYLTALPMRDLLSQVSALPPHTIVLYSTLFKDGEGTPFVPHDVAERLSAASKAPVYGFLDQYIGHGIVGGRVYSVNAHGEAAARLVLKILAGTPPSNIPVVESEANLVQFDWRQLQRWGIRENQLPQGSTVLFRQLSFWEQYKLYVAGVIALITLQAGIIGGLLLQRKYRRRAEANSLESEERFRLVANSAPVLIWMAATDKLCEYFNRPWLEFTGRTSDEELGNAWVEGVHPDDLNSCLATYNRAFDRQEPFTMEYRLRRHDGEYRWVVDRGVPRFSPDGSLAGYIGSCNDITERKLAEEALTALSGQLIAAQEEERRRVAREIHDDYQQRLAMLANDIDSLRQDLGNPPAEAVQRLHHLWNEISELASDLHSLSHRLHSSTLETLGLVAGVSAFCHEFHNQHGLEIEFIHDNVPRGIPSDTALCLFRVTQEALRNVKRHSGTDHAEVRLERQGETMHLSVSDRGSGFDLKSRSSSAGIGIRSMEERLRLVGGHLEVYSGVSEGTTIDAWVPFTGAHLAATQS
jgi:PAS domain S-box-containing protein